MHTKDQLPERPFEWPSAEELQEESKVGMSPKERKLLSFLFKKKPKLDSELKDAVNTVVNKIHKK